MGGLTFGGEVAVSVTVFADFQRCDEVWVVERL